MYRSSPSATYTLSLHDALPILPVDLSGVKPGPIAVETTESLLTVHWKDEAGRAWTADFALEPRSPLIAAIAVDGDRKSTRLNSSHPSISYAVFCLKKKNPARPL